MRPNEVLSYNNGICLKTVKVKMLQGGGEDYRGTASRTRYGDQCQPWDSPETGEWFDEEQIEK